MPIMPVIVAPGNCLTFTNRFLENKLSSVTFNIKSPAMQMLPSGHLFGVLLDGRLSSCAFQNVFSGIASFFRLLFRHLE